MDKSLLRKFAIQSLALMFAVITYSYARNQYQPVTIEAVGQMNDNIADNNTAFAGTLENLPGLKSQAKLTSAQMFGSIEDQDIKSKLGDQYLVIKKPQGYNLSMKLDDEYINKSIELTISGMETGVYTKGMISRVRGEDIFHGEPAYTEKTSTKVDENNGDKEKVVTRDYGNDFCHGLAIKTKLDPISGQFTAKVQVELDKVYAYKIYEDTDNFYVDIRKPSEVYDKILVIDAGHGGKDSGALSRYDKYYEKNVNLQILQDLKKLLDKQNIKVYYTRTEDETVYLRPRVELANEVDCDYFISIHCNANKISWPNGTEVLYYDKKYKGVKSSDLAKLFSKEVDKTISLSNKGIVKKHNEDVYIMHKAKVPMILIEVGYVTNYNDMNYLSKDKSRKAVAKGIYNGIMKAYEKLPVDK